MMVSFHNAVASAAIGLMFAKMRTCSWLWNKWRVGHRENMPASVIVSTCRVEQVQQDGEGITEAVWRGSIDMSICTENSRATCDLKALGRQVWGLRLAQLGSEMMRKSLFAWEEQSKIVRTEVPMPYGIEGAIKTGRACAAQRINWRTAESMTVAASVGQDGSVRPRR